MPLLRCVIACVQMWNGDWVCYYEELRACRFWQVECQTRSDVHCEPWSHQL